MSYKDKLNHFINFYRQKTGWGKIVSMPGTHRQFTWIGIEVTPPHFASRLSNFITFALNFGVPFCVVFLIAYSHVNKIYTILTFFIIGLIVGITAAIFYDKDEKRLQLPKWDKYPEDLK